MGCSDHWKATDVLGFLTAIRKQRDTHCMIPRLKGFESASQRDALILLLPAITLHSHIYSYHVACFGMLHLLNICIQGAVQPCSATKLLCMTQAMIVAAQHSCTVITM
jgi:hypothetical protein